MPLTSLRFVAAFRFVLAALLALAMPAAAKLTVMHGLRGLHERTAVGDGRRAGPGRDQLAPDGQAQDSRLTLDATTCVGNVVLARLTGLAPGKAVAYRVTGDADSRVGNADHAAVLVEARRRARSHHRLRLVLFPRGRRPAWGGQDYGGGYDILDAIAAMKPDLMLWGGDNLYFQKPDELDPAAMAMRYQRQRTFAPLQKLLTATSHLAIWDDHDYGPNDADMSYVMKGDSLQLFRRFWANPSYGLPDVPGMFGRARWGDVDVFLLDDRWYRSANRAIDGPDKTMFGAQQLAWLRNALIYSRAPIKLVVNRQPDVESRQPLRRLESFRDRATSVRGLAGRRRRSTACSSSPATVISANC